MSFFKRMTLPSLLVNIVLWFFLTSAALSSDVKKMSKEELKSIMDNKGISIIDVRQGKDWSSSEFKIKGAERVDVTDFTTWADKFPKNNTLVLYCA